MRLLVVALLLVFPLAGCLDDPLFRASEDLEPEPEPVWFGECDQLHLFVPARASDYAAYVPEGFEMVTVEGAEDLVLLPAWYSRCLDFTGMSGYVPEFDQVGEAWITVPVQPPAHFGLESVSLDVVPVRALVDASRMALVQDWGLGDEVQAGDVGMVVSANTGSINNNGFRSTVFQAQGNGWAWDAAAETFDDSSSFAADPMRIWISDGGVAEDYIFVDPNGGDDRGSGGAALMGDWPEAPEGAPGAAAHAVRDVDFTWTLRSVGDDA